MEHKSNITVRYAETDAQGITHHATYPIWFEEGRSDFLRKIDLPYSYWEKCGYLVVVVDLQVRYIHPAYYEDQLTVITSLKRFTKRLMEFNYQVINADDKLLAQGVTKHLMMERSGKPIALSTDFYQQMQQKLT